MVKNEIIKEIKGLMNKHHITISDLLEKAKHNYISEKFDIFYDGVGNRLPFNIGKEISPIGIFPFDDVDTYLCIMPNNSIKDSYIPSIYFMERVSEIRAKLNDKLNKLGAPIIEGKYLAYLDENSLTVVEFGESPKFSVFSPDEYFDDVKKLYVCDFINS